MKVESLRRLNREELEEKLNILEKAYNSQRIDKSTFLSLKQQILRLILINIDTEIAEKKRLIAKLEELSEVQKSHLPA